MPSWSARSPAWYHRLGFVHSTLIGRRCHKPWQHRSWIVPRDPGFATKGGRVLDLCAHTWDGQPLVEHDYVINLDDRPQRQAFKRNHPGCPAGIGQVARVEFEYTRGSPWPSGLPTRSTGEGDRADRGHHRHRPFARLVEQAMTADPCASAERVFWVVDNGSSHAGQASIQRMRDAEPNARLVHLPVHGSWLNQMEIYFSILQRKALTPADLIDLEHVASRVLAFQSRYNRTAASFDWRYTRTDLNNVLRHLDTNEGATAA